MWTGQRPPAPPPHLSGPRGLERGAAAFPQRRHWRALQQRAPHLGARETGWLSRPQGFLGDSVPVPQFPRMSTEVKTVEPADSTGPGMCVALSSCHLVALNKVTGWSLQLGSRVVFTFWPGKTELRGVTSGWQACLAQAQACPVTSACVLLGRQREGLDRGRVHPVCDAPGAPTPGGRPPGRPTGQRGTHRRTLRRP